MPTAETHSGPQALLEQLDMCCPVCPWKEAAYQRERTLCSGLAIVLGWGRQSRALSAGGSQQANWDGRSGEGRGTRGCAAGQVGTSTPPIGPLRTSLPLYSSSFSPFPYSLSDSWWGFSLPPFIYSFKQYLRNTWNVQ